MNVEEIRCDQNYSRYSDILSEIYSYKDPGRDHEYNNPYKLKEFIFNDSVSLKEHVFLCPLKKGYDDEIIIPHHVSKEYNVGPFAEPYMAGRFILSIILPQHSNSYNVFLAEEPATALMESDLNVELYYLHMRKYIQPGKLIIKFE